MKKAVLFLSMGGPETEKEIIPFLFRLFSDPAIIGLPAVLRFPLAALLAHIRARKSRIIYRLIGGGSPQRGQAEVQAKAVESKLGEGYRCFVGMRYASPSINEAVKEIRSWGAEEVILFPLYPQRSKTTTDTALAAAHKPLRRTGDIKTRVIENFPDQEWFVSHFAERLQSAHERALKKGTPKILFSAHGLPQYIVRQGDSYPSECARTVEAIIRKSGINKPDHVLCYQSRVGPVQWIKPFTDEEILCAARARRPLILIPISFVCEHVETLYEMDILYSQIAMEAGCPHFERIETPKAEERFIQGLAETINYINLNNL